MPNLDLLVELGLCLAGLAGGRDGLGLLRLSGGLLRLELRLKACRPGLLVFFGLVLADLVRLDGRCERPEKRVLGAERVDFVCLGGFSARLRFSDFHRELRAVVKLVHLVLACVRSVVPVSVALRLLVDQSLHLWRIAGPWKAIPGHLALLR